MGTDPELEALAQAAQVEATSPDPDADFIASVTASLAHPTPEVAAIEDAAEDAASSQPEEEDAERALAKLRPRTAENATDPDQSFIEAVRASMEPSLVNNTQMGNNLLQSSLRETTATASPRQPEVESEPEHQITMAEDAKQEIEANKAFERLVGEMNDRFENAFGTGLL